MQLKLRRFDMRTLKDDAVVVFIGARNTGKTTNLLSVLHHHRDSFPLGMVISATEGANNTFSKHVPEMLIYEQYEPQLLEKFRTRQMAMTKQMRAEELKYGKATTDPRAFLILDDCLYDNSWTKDENIRYLFMNGRHIKSFVCITMQYPLGIPPNLRANIDYVFIGRCNMIKDRQRIYEQYAGMFPNFEVFCTVLDACTENYECIVINKRTQSNKIEDQVFWYKAPTNLQFKMCSRELWDLQIQEQQRRAMGMSTVDEDEEEEYDPTVTKKKGPLIRVKKQG